MFGFVLLVKQCVWVCFVNTTLVEEVCLTRLMSLSAGGGNVLGLVVEEDLETETNHYFKLWQKHAWACLAGGGNA